MPNLAVLGAGRIGQVHADAIARVPGASLVAVADAFEDAANAVAAKHGCAVRSIDEIADSADVDAVLICTPTDTHADLIERFCKLGKAVFCEKPIDLNLDRVRGCLKVVEQSGGQLMVGFNRRFDPDFAALKAAVDAGHVGQVEMVTITSRDPSAPPVSYIEKSGGIFRDMTIHDFDIARWMLGEEVETIFANASNLVDPAIGAADDYDSLNVTMMTASGKHCTITNSRRAAYGYDQRIEVFGEKGAATAHNHHESTVEVASSAGYTKPPLQNFFMDRYMDAYVIEISEFILALQNGTQMPTSGHDGMMALAMADAAVLSVREGRKVRLDEV